MPCSPNRFQATLQQRIPLVLSVGALDMVNFGSKASVPEQFANRHLHIHNDQVSRRSYSWSTLQIASRFDYYDIILSWRFIVSWMGIRRKVLLWIWTSSKFCEYVGQHKLGIFWASDLSSICILIDILSCTPEIARPACKAGSLFIWSTSGLLAFCQVTFDDTWQLFGYEATL